MAVEFTGSFRNDIDFSFLYVPSLISGAFPVKFSGKSTNCGGSPGRERRAEWKPAWQRQPRSTEIRDLMEQFPLRGDSVFYSPEIQLFDKNLFHSCFASWLPRPREKSGDKIDGEVRAQRRGGDVALTYVTRGREGGT